MENNNNVEDTELNARIEDIKLYARIDEDDGNEVIWLINTAETYLKNAGVTCSYENSLYLLVVKMLVKHWYDNREILTSNDKKMPLGITDIINQLQFQSLESLDTDNETE